MISPAVIVILALKINFAMTWANFEGRDQESEV